MLSSMRVAVPSQKLIDNLLPIILHRSHIQSLIALFHIPFTQGKPGDHISLMDSGDKGPWKQSWSVGTEVPGSNHGQWGQRSLCVSGTHSPRTARSSHRDNGPWCAKVTHNHQPLPRNVFNMIQQGAFGVTTNSLRHF